MKTGAFRFDRLEFSGALGDLGTLIPLSVALIAVNGLGFTPLFLLVGISCIATGASDAARSFQARRRNASPIEIWPSAWASRTWPPARRPPCPCATARALRSRC